MDMVSQESTGARRVSFPGDPIATHADHRIGNNLAMVASLLRIQASELANEFDHSIERARDALAATALRIENVGRLHRLLSENGGSERVEVGDYVREVTLSVGRSLARPGAIRIGHEFGSPHVTSAKRALPIGLIVGEITTNAIKYAHPAGIPTLLTVRCAGYGNSVHIEVEDDGVGLPEDFDTGRDGGLGLRLVRLLAKQLGAKIAFTNRPLGLHFSMRVPGGIGGADPET
jgi:two-component sensor histidine kinase